MSTNEKKGITVKIDAELHAEVRQFLDKHEMTMAEFVTLALQDELHPKINLQEGKNMGNMRTLAFQVSEELFQQIKDYLQRNNMTQKQFVIGLIETEIERDLTQRAAMDEVHTETEEMAEEQTEVREIDAVSNCESVSEELEQEYEEQENDDFLEDFEEEEEVESMDEESEEEFEDEEQYKDEDMIEKQEESEGMVMSMGM
ncbi:MAG TPA: hypothetical protein DDX91_01500 [Ruminococcaceae bacterium]|nr:hypothetical protein [Oscillospiraceae bacterium]